MIWVEAYVFAVPAFFLAAAHQLTIPGTDRQVQERLPLALRGPLAVQAVVMLVFGVLLFAHPGDASSIWPWPLTPLAAEAIAAWLLGIGGSAAYIAIRGDRADMPGPAVSCVVLGAIWLAGALASGEDFEGGVGPVLYVLFAASVLASAAPARRWGGERPLRADLRAGRDPGRAALAGPRRAAAGRRRRGRPGGRAARLSAAPSAADAARPRGDVSGGHVVTRIRRLTAVTMPRGASQSGVCARIGGPLVDGNVVPGAERAGLDAAMPNPTYPWERPLGARPVASGRTAFRVWAPRAQRLALRLDGAEHELTDAGCGVYEVELPAAEGARYCYVVDGSTLPDPGTRWQPDGLRGPSAVVDPGAFEWTDEGWRPPALREQVLYELHVGTFTQEGTFEAAIAHLAGLRDLGVTAIELMPIAEFPGRHGWGYDGVYLNAAHSAYGGPRGLQRLVDAAHAHGLCVILDVVYNHLGASGVEAMEAFGPHFTQAHQTPWGDAFNLDGAECDPVREWVLQSAEDWVRDFHVDGLRLDAIHAIIDVSPEHLVGAIVRRVHAVDPRALVIAEAGLNDPRVVRAPEIGGWGCDAVWADDFHHALRVLLTGERAGYYEEFGALAQLAKAYHRPHVHDGGYSTFRRRRFGAPADDVAPERFVVFWANHDQVGNRALGDRLAPEVRPLAALCTLLAPFTPMLFQGEEYGERAPFQFFSDHVDEAIARATREGRRREFAAFAEFAGTEVPDPQDPATFERSKLTREGAPRGMRTLTARLLAARRELPAGDADEIAFDEHAGWLRVRRGDFEILANFARASVHVPLERALAARVCTHHATLEPGYVVLPPLSGALLG